MSRTGIISGPPAWEVSTLKKSHPGILFIVIRNIYIWLMSPRHTYDLYGPMRNVFYTCRYILRTSGRGLGPGNREFFGPCEMVSSRKVSAIWGPKYLHLLIHTPSLNHDSFSLYHLSVDVLYLPHPSKQETCLRAPGCRGSGGHSQQLWIQKIWEIYIKHSVETWNQIHSSWLGEVVDSGIGLSYQPVSLQPGRPIRKTHIGVNFSPHSGTMNSPIGSLGHKIFHEEILLLYEEIVQDV
jgi:hypothetical protein